jgi:hypothetical protein
VTDDRSPGGGVPMTHIHEIAGADVPDPVRSVTRERHILLLVVEWVSKVVVSAENSGARSMWTQVFIRFSKS